MPTPAQNIIFDTLRAGLWTAVTMATPLLISALVVGVAMGVFQALTSVQEATLTFVPKVAVMLLMFWVSMSGMTSTMVNYFQEVLMPVISGG